MKKPIIIAVLIATVLITVAIAIKLFKNDKEIIGGQTDEHGCLISVGYSWDEEALACMRGLTINKDYLKSTIRAVAEKLGVSYGLHVDKVEAVACKGRCFIVYVSVIDKDGKGYKKLSFNVQNDLIVDKFEVATPTSDISDLIQVTSPTADALITSPLTITGKARGSWFFEASFPVHLLDENGNDISSAPATAQGDWMTPDFVNFEVTLEFTKPEGDEGTLVLQKDNPSGLPENDDELRIPIKFN